MYHRTTDVVSISSRNFNNLYHKSTNLVYLCIPILQIFSSAKILDSDKLILKSRLGNKV